MSEDDADQLREDLDADQADADQLPAILPAAAPVAARPLLELVEAFLAGRKATTRKAYRSSLADFARFAGAGGLEAACRAFLRLSRGEAHAIGHRYAAHLVERKLAPATVALRITTLRAFVTFGRQCELVEWSLEISAPRVVKLRDTRGPGLDGWRKIREASLSRGDTPIARRDLAALLLLHDNGLRRSEVLGLDLADIDLDGLRVAIVGKGFEERQWVTLNRPTALAIRHWIEARGRDPGPLFIALDPAAPAREAKGKPPGRLSGDNLARAVARLGRIAGLDRKARPHGLRHQAITHALELTGGHVPDVQQFSRHSDPKTLMRYNDARTDAAGRIARLLGEDV